ncbi:SH3-like domain-containing protein, partial [Liquorilactobacillus sicerae]|uniref:SH3-like domain-containing protein n=1 Tax=Liquorilactobacillus sicerae TaxID=1416943 RepID=UPI0024810267
IVTVDKIAVTKRANGKTYTYVYVQDGSHNYWIDERAIHRLDQIISTQSMTTNGNQYAIIDGTTRDDGIYLNGPAYTSKNTFYSDDQANKYNGHTITVLQTAVTQRSNGISYKYAEVQDGSKTYWIDARALKKTVLIRTFNN